MTFSVLGRVPANGDLDVAMQPNSLASAVSFRTGARMSGFVATQAFANPTRQRRVAQLPSLVVLEPRVQRCAALPEPGHLFSAVQVRTPSINIEMSTSTIAIPM